mmetsp:Transcript_27430/g.78816  ORF Transcript_27430/g.78816 Transcript_27430/m.78816 type:complete len:188 (-) Transcript_27430:84-647(-)
MPVGGFVPSAGQVADAIAPLLDDQSKKIQLLAASAVGVVAYFIMFVCSSTLVQLAMLAGTFGTVYFWGADLAALLGRVVDPPRPNLSPGGIRPSENQETVYSGEVHCKGVLALAPRSLPYHAPPGKTIVAHRPQFRSEDVGPWYYKLSSGYAEVKHGSEKHLKYEFQKHDIGRDAFFGRIEVTLRCD